VPAGAWHVLGVVFAATVVMALGSTMLNIALPTMARELGASASQANAALVAYLLTNVAFTIPMGQLADSLDRRRMFLAGLGGFLVTSVLLSVARSITDVVVLRALQGIAAAVLLSNSVAILAAVFPHRRLPRAMAVYLAGFAIAQVLGPTLGGLVTVAWGWRWVFGCLVPITLVALILGWRALSKVSLPSSTGWRIDVRGNLLLGGIVTAVLLAVTISPGVGWADPWVLGLLGVAGVLLPLLFATERRVPHPAIDLDLLRDPVLGRGILAGFLVNLPRLSVMVVAALLFQGLYGDSAAEAAVKVTVVAGGLTLGAMVAEPICHVVGQRATMVASPVLSSVGLVVLAVAVDPHEHLAALQVGLLLVGLGTGVFGPLNLSMLMLAVPLTRAGSVNALRVMLQSASLSLAIALSVSLVLAWAPVMGRNRFMAGAASALSREDVSSIVTGYRVVFGSMSMLLLVAVFVVLVTPQPKPARVAA